MARTIYSTRFLVASLTVNNGFAKSFVVPAGKVAVIRQLTVDFFVGPATFTLALNTLPGPVLVPIARWSTQPTGTIIQWETRVVVNEGETMTVTNNTGGSTAVTCQCSGYLLTV